MQNGRVLKRSSSHILDLKLEWWAQTLQTEFFFSQLNWNYILNYLQLPETISKLEINFLGTGPSRSAVKWTILCSWPPTPVSPSHSLARTRQGGAPGRSPISMVTWQALAGGWHSHIFTTSQITVSCRFVTFCWKTVLVLFLRTRDHFILEFNWTIFMQQVLSSGI